MELTWLSQVVLGSSSVNHSILHLELGHMMAKDDLMRNVETYLHSFAINFSHQPSPPSPPLSSLLVTLVIFFTPFVIPSPGLIHEASPSSE